MQGLLTSDSEFGPSRVNLMVLTEIQIEILGCHIRCSLLLFILFLDCQLSCSLTNLTCGMSPAQIWPIVDLRFSSVRPSQPEHFDNQYQFVCRNLSQVWKVVQVHSTLHSANFATTSKRHVFLVHFLLYICCRKLCYESTTLIIVMKSLYQNLCKKMPLQ